MTTYVNAKYGPIYMACICIQCDSMCKQIHLASKLIAFCVLFLVALITIASLLPMYSCSMPSYYQCQMMRYTI